MGALSYLVRKRNVLTGVEEWLVDREGEPVIFDDRLHADLAVLFSDKLPPNCQYAYVAELDLSCEDIIT